MVETQTRKNAGKGLDLTMATREARGGGEKQGKDEEKEEKKEEEKEEREEKEKIVVGSRGVYSQRRWWGSDRTCSGQRASACEGPLHECTFQRFGIAYPRDLWRRGHG